MNHEEREKQLVDIVSLSHSERDLEKRLAAVERYIFEVKLHRDSRVGPQGPQGDAGVSDVPGPQGPVGKDGRDGKNAKIEIGNVGMGGPDQYWVGLREAGDVQFIDILLPAGRDGKNGEQGPIGERGPQGEPASAEDIRRVAVEILSSDEVREAFRGERGLSGRDGEQGPTVWQDKMVAMAKILPFPDLKVKLDQRGRKVVPARIRL